MCKWSGICVNTLASNNFTCSLLVCDGYYTYLCRMDIDDGVKECRYIHNIMYSLPYIIFLPVNLSFMVATDNYPYMRMFLQVIKGFIPQLTLLRYSLTPHYQDLNPVLQYLLVSREMYLLLLTLLNWRIQPMFFLMTWVLGGTMELTQPI